MAKFQKNFPYFNIKEHNIKPSTYFSLNLQKQNKHLTVFEMTRKRQQEQYNLHVSEACSIREDFS